MQIPTQRKKIFQRQIPTLLGLLILVIALGAGLFFFSDGLGVFAPRATPETTPQDIRLTNVTDTGFTVSFLTDESTPGFIKYGDEAGNLRSQASDDRDQLSGSVGSFTLHHITVRGLQPDTTYYYILGTGSRSEFDDEGQPFSVTTARRAGTPTAAKTIYGNVLNSNGGPAEGSIVYVSSPDVGDMSSLVKSSGSWAVPLSNARTSDGSGYAQITDTTPLTLQVQGTVPDLTSQLTVAVGDAQPVAPITLGQNGPAVVDNSLSASPSPVVLASPSPSPSPSPRANSTPASSSSANLTGGALRDISQTATSSSTIVDLTQTTIPTITTSQPTIIGEAAPNVVVSIQVNSDTQIDQQITADATGDFELDLATLQQELEPGEHTIVYSYVDPQTGQTVTETKSFTVEPTVQLAQANSSPSPSPSSSPTPSATPSPSSQPFGSGNPFPVGASPTPSPSIDPTATNSASSSSKGGVSSSSGRTSQPSTSSGIPTSGSVTTTYALLLGGIFFLITGLWSFWMSRQLKEV